MTSCYVQDAESVFKGHYETWESAVLVVLGVVLAIVLFRRRQLRAGHYRHQRETQPQEQQRTSHTGQQNGPQTESLPTAAATNAVRPGSHNESPGVSTQGGSAERPEGSPQRTELTENANQLLSQNVPATSNTSPASIAAQNRDRLRNMVVPTSQPKEEDMAENLSAVPVVSKLDEGNVADSAKDSGNRSGRVSEEAKGPEENGGAHEELQDRQRDSEEPSR